MTLLQPLQSGVTLVLETRLWAKCSENEQKDHSEDLRYHLGDQLIVTVQALAHVPGSQFGSQALAHGPGNCLEEHLAALQRALHKVHR